MPSHLQKIFEDEFQRASRPVTVMDEAIVDEMNGLIEAINQDGFVTAKIETDYFYEDLLTVRMRLANGDSASVNLHFDKEERGQPGKGVKVRFGDLFDESDRKVYDLAKAGDQQKLITHMIRATARKLAENERNSALQALYRSGFGPK